MLHSRRRFHANAPGTTPRFPIPPSAAELSDRGSDGIPPELAQKDRQSSACQSLSAWPRDQQEIWADSAFEPLLDVTAGRFDLDFEWQRSCSLNVQVSFNSNHEGHEVTPRKSSASNLIRLPLCPLWFRNLLYTSSMASFFRHKLLI